MENKQIKQINNNDLQNFKDYLNWIEHFGFSGTVLLAKDAEILINQGYGYQDFEKTIPMNKSSVLSIGSISKQFTSTMIMKFVEDKKLNLSDALNKFFPTTPDDKKNITIYQLLTHTSGINDRFGNDFLFVEEEKFLQQVFDNGLGSPPGEAFNYSNHGYSLLGIILQKISKKPYQRLLIDDFLKSLTINNVGWFGDPKWNENNSVSYYLDCNNTGSVSSWQGSWDKPYWYILGNGGVCISAENLFQWVHAVMTKQVITDQSLNQLLTPDQNDYAFGWDVIDSPFGKLIKHDGGNDIGVNAICRYYKDQRITLIILSNIMNNGFGMAMQIEEVWEELIASNDFKLPSLPKYNPAIELSEYLPKSFELDNGNILHIKQNNIGHIQANVEGQHLLNFIFEVNEKENEMYERWNSITKTVGELFLQERWEDAFSYFKNKQVSERRVNYIKEMLKFFNGRYGRILEIQARGSLPFMEFCGMSLLTIIGENGNSGIPLIWEDNNTLLGFRPLPTEFPLSLVGAVDEEGLMLTSYNINLDLKFRSNSLNKNFELINGNNQVVLYST